MFFAKGTEIVKVKSQFTSVGCRKNVKITVYCVISINRYTVKCVKCKVNRLTCTVVFILKCTLYTVQLNSVQFAVKREMELISLGIQMNSKSVWSMNDEQCSVNRVHYEQNMTVIAILSK